MSVQVENLEQNTAKLTIEVPFDEFEKAVQNVYLKQKGKIAIPGFRKGKVPRQIIEKMYGSQVFYEDAANEVIRETYPKEAESTGLKILTAPRIDIDQIEKGKPFVYAAVVAVYPEVELGEYKGVEVPITEIKVTDEEIEAELKKEQEKNSRIITVDDRPAAMGDTVVFDYTGTIDGTEFEGGSAKNHSLVLGSGQFIPGFEEQLVGMSVDEEKDINVTFPADYHAAELQGKAAVFHCALHRIENKELPELDDDFAQDVSEFDTFAEYKADVEKKIMEKKEKRAKDAKRQAAVDKVVAAAKIDLSDMIIRERSEQMIEQLGRRLEQQGMSLEQYFKFSGMTADQILEMNNAQAEKELRQSFVLDKIAQIENVEVSDERVEQELADMAKAYGIEVEEYKSYLPEGYAAEMKEELKLTLAAEIIGDAAVETEAATKEAEEADKKQAEAIVEETAADIAEAEKTQEA